MLLLMRFILPSYAHSILNSRQIKPPIKIANRCFCFMDLLGVFYSWKMQNAIFNNCICIFPYKDILISLWILSILAVLQVRKRNKLRHLRAPRAKIPPYLDKNTPLFFLQNAVLGKNTPLFILQNFAIFRA